MGKPRRLSPKYLEEERQKLKSYREEVRAQHSGRHITNSKVYEEYLDEIPAPINVGTAVIARHPKDGELYPGKVLVKDGHKYRIQFDDQALGQPALIDDIHVMSQVGAAINTWRRRHPARENEHAAAYNADSSELTERRNALNDEIRELSEEMQTIQAEGQMPPEAMQNKCNELQVQLADTEEMLKALHEHVAQMQVKIPTIQLAPKLLADQCLAAARSLVKDAWNHSDGNVDKAEAEAIQELISGCLGVLFGLHDTGSRSPTDVKEVMDHVLQRIKPLKPLCGAEFNNIESVLNIIRDLVAADAGLDRC